MKNSVCVFLIIFGISWENQPALAKNCYSSLVGSVKTCGEIFRNDEHAIIGVEELQLLKSKYFHCFQDSSPGEIRCEPHFSDKCLRATLKFEDGSESVFLSCDNKNNSICKKLMTENKFPDRFGKKLNRKLSVCQHCYEDLCNMKSGLRPGIQKFPNQDLLALIKRDADETTTTNGLPTGPPKEDEHSSDEDNLHLPPQEADIHSAKPEEPEEEKHDDSLTGGVEGRPKEHDDHKQTSVETATKDAETATKNSEQENKELKCYQSDADQCEAQGGSIKAYNCMRSAKVIEKDGCAVCVTATVIAKDKDTFQMAMCSKDPSGTQCKHMNSDWAAEGEVTMGKGIKEVKCDLCKIDLCNKVTPKSHSTKHALPNLVIFILAAIFLALI